VGGPEQAGALEASQLAGEIGCFALTEKLAGVQSGLLVQTTAAYDDATDEFVLHTPSEGACKNWISQGFTADKAVVLADLTVGGKRRGPHAFLMDLRHRGELAQGVSVGDMGVKTTGNDLDNAWIRFDHARVPRSALLNRYADVDAGGTYAVKDASIAPFEMIGQRLFTGRVAVAQAALSYCRKLFEVTREYADAKPIWSPLTAEGAAHPTLSSIPQLRSLFAEAEAKTARLEAFVAKCEHQLVPLLISGAVPDAALTHAIATAKVRAVEGSIDLCWRLKQEVGSYALMGDSGFVHLDFLNCCKFAEGDSRILMQKMARDTMRHAKKHRGEGLDAQTLAICQELGRALAAANGDKAAEAQLWDENWTLVYGLADAIMDKTMEDF
jgi:acyl-CoA oxidase